MTERAYSYEELGELKPQILDICERVRQDNPTAWRQAHNGSFDDASTRYNDLCVQALRAAGIFAGCNGKRGGDQRSDDVLTFGLTDGRGARDASGRFPSIAIIDYIAGAGGPTPSIGWGDVSAASGGRFLDPQGLARVDGGGGVAPPPPPPPDTIANTLAEVRATQAVQSAMLRGIAEKLAALEAREPESVDLGRLNEYVDDMIGNGPGGEAENHVTDIKERLDVLRVQLEQLNAWLRSRTILRR